jgi:hypothetical protein
MSILIRPRVLPKTGNDTTVSKEIFGETTSPFYRPGSLREAAINASYASTHKAMR